MILLLNVMVGWRGGGGGVLFTAAVPLHGLAMRTTNSGCGTVSAVFLFMSNGANDFLF